LSGTYAFLKTSPAIQLLLLNSFTINCGFYMLYPYLTVYFREDLGFAAWMIGLILGVRVFAQQGMTFFGGGFADRVGYKLAIMVGLSVRAIGFAGLGLASSFPAVLAAAIVSGLGGAVFSPASRAYMSDSVPGQRAEAFALDNAFTQAGTLLGPLLGLALLSFDFRAVALVAAGVFLALMLFQSTFLPDVKPAGAESRPSMRAGWGEVLRNRPFVLFAIAMFGQFTLVNQLYLGLPLEIERLTNSQSGVGALFIVASVLTILLQIKVTSFLKPRVRPPVAIAAGLLIMGLAFLPTLVSASAIGERQETVKLFSSASAVLLLPLCSSVLLALGVMVATPFSLEMVSRFGRGGLTATYFGVFTTASGIGATAGNVLTGIAFDKQESMGFQGLPWLFMIGLGAACGLFMLRLSRRPDFQQVDQAALSPGAPAAKPR